MSQMNTVVVTAKSCAMYNQFLSDGLLASKPEVRTPIGAARKLDCIISQPSPGSSTDL